MKIKAALKPIQVKGPFDRVAVDCMGPLPITETGNRFIIVFIDYYTKYVEACATNDITSTTIAQKFIELIVCRHGSPRILQSDHGTDFMSRLIVEITRLCNTNQ